MLAVAEGFGEIALQLAAVVGLPDQIAQRDAKAIQVVLNSRSEHGTGRSAACLSKSPDSSPLRISRRCMHNRQVQALRLPPVARDIV